MSNTSVIELAPSFDQINMISIESCLENGAAKIDNLLSPGSVERLATGTIPGTAAEFVLAASELSQFFDAFKVEPDTKLRSERPTSLSFAFDDGPPPHIDRDPISKTTLKGMSLLMPMSGEPALFGASNEKFVWNQIPSFLTEYGVGDGMLLRQEIESVNGISCFMLCAWHLGVAATTRTFLAIDLDNPNIRY